MGKILKIATGFIGIICISVIAGFLLLAVVQYVPQDAKKLEAAAEVLYEQNTSADYPLLNAWAQNYFTYRPGVFDGNTATLIFQYSTRSLEGQNPLRLALVEEYPRYWHGYVLIMRPLLAVFEYKDLEIFFSYLLMMAAMAIAAVIGKRKGVRCSLAFGTSFLMLMPMIVGICTQYLWIALITYGAILVFMRWEDWLNEKERFLFFFLIVGILTVYFDFLTYPIYTWGITAVWWLLLEKKERTAKEALSFTVLSAIAWAAGYVGMWMGKWILGSVLLHQNLLADAINQILFRTGMEDSLTIRERLYVVYKNWKHYGYVLNALMLTAWLVYYLVNGFVRGWKRSGKAPAFCLIILSAFVWNMGAANHMEIHHFFTYRIYGVAVMGWLAFVLEAVPERAERKAVRAGDRGKYLLLVGAAGLMAFLFTLVTYEETEVSNKTSEGFEPSVFYGGTLEVELTPEFPRITQVCVALLAEKEEGEYVLRLKDGDQVLDRQNVPVSYMDGLNYKLYPVDWKLKKGHAYVLSVETPKNGGSFTAFIKGTEGAAMTELGEASLNGEALDGEPCVGISYWARPVSKALKVFWMISWLALFSVGVYFAGYARYYAGT